MIPNFAFLGNALDLSMMSPLLSKYYLHNIYESFTQSPKSIYQPVLICRSDITGNALSDGWLADMGMLLYLSPNSFGD